MGDFGFYQCPTQPYWSGLFAGTPPTFTFGLNVSEEITVLYGRGRHGTAQGHRTMNC